MDDMLATMYDAPGVGLAAPQIGISRRLIVMDAGRDDEDRDPLVMVNPEILDLSDEMRVHEEGCLSIPEVTAEVERPAEVRVAFLDREGKPQEAELEGIWATIVQHEIDHLNGVLFIDYLSRLKRDMIVKKFTKAEARRGPVGPIWTDCASLRLPSRIRRGPMRIIFMGTPDFAVPALQALLEAGHDIVAVYTQPPRAAGRGMALRKSPVHEAADAAGLTVLTPERLKAKEEQNRFAAFQADAAVVVAYGIILPKAVLDGTKAGLFNIHASLLPRWRGAAPINRAIMSGDAETGVAIMRVDRRARRRSRLSRGARQDRPGR